MRNASDWGPVVLTVSDDGVGIPVDLTRRGNGLTNMQERARNNPGEFSWAPAKGGGTVSLWSARGVAGGSTHRR